MSNLASIIMEGVGYSGSYANNYNFDFSDDVITESYMDDAIADLYCGIFEAKQSYEIGDIVGAATIIRENALGNYMNPDSVMEGVIKSGIDKLKEIWAKFIAKIKEYYKRIVNWFKAMFSNGEDFVARYGKLVKEKARQVKGFSYSGYKYDISGGDADVEKAKKGFKDVIELFLKKLDVTKPQKEFSKQYYDECVKKYKELGGEGEIPDDKDTDYDDDYYEDLENTKEVFDHLGYEDMSDMKKQLVEKYRGGKAKVTITNFSAISVDKMCTCITGSDKQITTVEKSRTTLENGANKMIRKLDGVKAKDVGEKEYLVRLASSVSKRLTNLLNGYKAAADIYIQMRKEMDKEFLSVLKAFYRYKGNKDYLDQMESSMPISGYDPFEYSILESSDPDDTEEEGDAPEKGGVAESTLAGILEHASNYRF